MIAPTGATQQNKQTKMIWFGEPKLVAKRLHQESTKRRQHQQQSNQADESEDAKSEGECVCVSVCGWGWRIGKNDECRNKPAIRYNKPPLLYVFVTIKIAPQSTYALISLNENGKVTCKQCLTLNGNMLKWAAKEKVSKMHLFVPEGRSLFIQLRLYISLCLCYSLCAWVCAFRSIEIDSQTKKNRESERKSE